MTRDEVIAKWNSMGSRERDAWVATDVMCWSVYHFDKDVPERCYYMLVNESFDSVVNEVGWNAGERKTEEEVWEDCPHFTTDISAAWEVIDKLSKTHFTEVAMTQLDDGAWGWMARFILAEGEPYWVKGYRMTATTVQEAICLAALIATQGEGIEHEQ